MSHRPTVLLVLLAGCARAPQPALETRAPATAAADTTVEGTVRLEGPAEAARIVLRGVAGSVGLTGSLSDELRRLSGATVRVTGAPQDNSSPMPARAVAVQGYQILEVDGERPVVGVLVSRDARLWLAGGDTVELMNAAPDLASRLGAKVYVIGVRAGNRLQVRSYGVIRDPR